TNRRNPFAYCKGVFPCSPAPPPARLKKPPKNLEKQTTTKNKKKRSVIKKQTKQSYTPERGGVGVFSFQK
ncbi:hypothetical protein, partial [Enterobacter intestinihominis]